MQDIDEKIRSNLNDEDQKIMDEIDRGTGFFDLLGMGFKGKQAWMMYYMYFLGFVVFAALIYFVMQFFDTDDLKTSLAWALAIITCLFLIMLVKIMAWQQLFKLELLRELKRLEMRLMLANERAEKSS